jgi:polyphenol oxidase
MANNIEFIYPDWPAPSNVRAVSTTRAGGVSHGPYASFNLGDHVGDDPVLVKENRTRLRAALSLPADPVWLKQVHGTHIIEATQSAARAGADGAWCSQLGSVCAVLTADCLPVFLCNEAGTKVALLHGGWRGLAAGVIANGVHAMGGDTAHLMAWLGPAIGPQVFEVGPEVRQAFQDRLPSSESAFVPVRGGRYLADLYALARLDLNTLGVTRVYGGGFCTYTDRERFFSYRQNAACGRMASLIWLG